MRKKFKAARRIVLKAGTSILTSPKGNFSRKAFSRLGRGILSLLRERREVVLVSSGAIALGMETLRLKSRPAELKKLQACAAIGQGKLMHAYEEFFSKHRIHTAQILLTRDGLETKERFLTAKHTLDELFKMGILPVVNENDTVATEEIAFGDNDFLSVWVAHLIHADLLILLSDVDGFYLAGGSRVRTVEDSKQIEKTLVAHVQDKRKEKTVGGMKAKLQAARIAMRLGVPLVIVSGHEEKIIQRTLVGEDVGTIFCASNSQKNARKKWIAFSAARKGAVVVDAGACEALRTKKRSLLPSGLVKIQGSFERGAIIELETLEGKVFGRGQVRYSSQELGQIAGKKTHEIQAVLGYKCPDEVIHRNDLVLWS